MGETLLARHPELGFLLFLCAGLVLYALDLRSFFVFDDLSHIHRVIVGPLSWAGSLAPWENGFWRPLVTLQTKAFVEIFGLRPLPFHVLPVVLHALVCLFTAKTFLRLYPGAHGFGLLAGWWLVFQIGAWPCVARPSNIAEIVVALSFLGGLWAWDRWIAARRPADLILVAGCFLLGLMGKESAVVYPVILFLWGVVRGRLGKPERIVLAIFLVIAGIFAVTSMILQSRAESYLTEGWVVLAPKSLVRQFADYVTSAFFPYLHVMAAPVVHPSVPHAVLWALRFGVCVLVLWSAWRFLQRRAMALWFPLLAVFVCLVLPSLIGGSPVGYYLYPALPFSAMVVAGALLHVRGVKRALLGAGIALVFLWSVLGFYLSPTVRGHRRLADDVESMVRQMRPESKRWPPGTTIAILHHPHPGAEPWRWVYCQEIMNMFFPEAHVKVALGEDPSAARTYDFVAGELVLVAQRDMPSSPTQSTKHRR